MVLPRELVTNHLDVDLLTHLEPEVTDEVLVNPRLKLTHPISKYVRLISKEQTSEIRSVQLISNVPQGGLAIGTLLGNGSGSIGSRALETSSGRVSLAGHGGVSRSRGTSGGGVSLVGEGIEVVERHCAIKRIRKFDVRI